MFRWRIGTDDVVPDAGWFIDDIRIYSCDGDRSADDHHVGSSGQVVHQAATAAVRLHLKDEAGSTFHCSVDGAPFTACATPYTTGKLKDGKHTFAVAAVSKLGNVDATPGEALVHRRQEAAEDQDQETSGLGDLVAPGGLQVRLEREEGRGGWVDLDGKKYKKCKTDPNFTVTSGSHTLRVKAVDRAGNKDKSAAAFTWRVRR